jgi:hypothetical protein
MLVEQVLTKQTRSTNEKEGANIQRRTFVGGALAALLSSSVRVMADDEHGPNDPFIVLLHGIYQPVPIGQGPAGNLGLTTVNLSDGSFSKTRIYPIYGVDGANDRKKAIGTFYPQVTLAKGKITFNGLNCAYDLPVAQSSCSSCPLRLVLLQGLTVSYLSLTERVGITWREPSNWTYRRQPESIRTFRVAITTW